MSRVCLWSLQGLVTLAIVVSSIRPAQADAFIRGDTDINGFIEITDPVRTLRFLFLGGLELDCLDGADADDNGVLELTDGIYTLNFLFSGGRPPLPPFADCGFDPIPFDEQGQPILDQLDCQLSVCSHGEILVEDENIEPTGHILSGDDWDRLALRSIVVQHRFDAMADAIGTPDSPQPITLSLFPDTRIDVVGTSVAVEVNEAGDETVLYYGRIPNHVDGRVLCAVSELGMVMTVHTDDAYYEVMPMAIPGGFHVVTEIDLPALPQEGEPVVVNQPRRLGDANCDGEVNPDDVLEIQRFLAGLVELCCDAAADIDGDGEIDAGDAALLNRLIREDNQEWELLEDCELDPQPVGRFEPRRGDVNCDEFVNQADADMLGQIILGNFDNIEICCPAAHDANGDNVINALDVVFIANGIEQVAAGAPLDEVFPLLEGCQQLADVNCDGVVDGEDVRALEAIVFQQARPCCPAAADIDGNGLLNGDDIEVLVAALGEDPPREWQFIQDPECRLIPRPVDPIDPVGPIDPGGGIIVGGGGEQGGGAGPVSIRVLLLLPNPYATLCDADGPFAGFKDLFRGIYEKNLDQVFKDSGTGIEAEVVLECYDYDPQGGDLSPDLNTICSDQIVNAMRTGNQADLVSMIVHTGGNCGLGEYNAAPSSSTDHIAHTVVKQSCSLANYSFAHEIGHNLGMLHDRHAMGGGGASSCNYGFHFSASGIGDGAPFNRSVMAYNSYCSSEFGITCKRVGVYSRPETVDYGFTQIQLGIPCTVLKVGIEGSADNQSQLIEAAPIISGYRPE